MDLRFSPEELAFRDELRAFIRDNLPTDIRDKLRLGYGSEKEDTIRWQRNPCRGGCSDSDIQG